MSQINLSANFLNDFVKMNSTELGDEIFIAAHPVEVIIENDTVVIKVAFVPQFSDLIRPDLSKPTEYHNLIVRAYGENTIRITLSLLNQIPDDSKDPMLLMDNEMLQQPLSVRESDGNWEIFDHRKRTRFRLSTQRPPIHFWSDQQPPPQDMFSGVVIPDGKTEIPFHSYDIFFDGQMESGSMGYIKNNAEYSRIFYSLYARNDEKFVGTGERFARMNLAGKTIRLENTDAMGVNSPRVYKNIPFYISNKLYGLLILTSSHVSLSLADISTRSAQGLVESDCLDLFFIGGDCPESIIKSYRSLTGFPQDVPLWSYGTWMSRMTYFSADETHQIVDRLIEEDIPCDVIHLDTGWFRKDWKCEWEFNPERFPDPQEYIKQMRDKGIRITLWQLPSVEIGTKYFELAKRRKYIAVDESITDEETEIRDIGKHHVIDFTNPEALAWYQGLLSDLLEMGIAAIKTDFGEIINMYGQYHAMSAEKLHNMYGLLYQRAAYEITEKVTKEPIIWARTGWVGCQRFPVHWGGDAASTWDGLAGSLRGGLHIGLSGFAFWSHDVGGFHGLPDFMNNRPSDVLYVRWSQLGVFSSHLRYHGTSAREPYEYPAVADIVRQWLKLRYALIPYLMEQGKIACRTGYPVLRALIFHHADDPFCWEIDDQFYFGDSFMVAPIMNPDNVRDVYLPPGTWVDFWTGEILEGPQFLKQVRYPLDRIPVYVPLGAEVPIYPLAVQSTNEMDQSKIMNLKFNENYIGLNRSVLGGLVRL